MSIAVLKQKVKNAVVKIIKKEPKEQIPADKKSFAELSFTHQMILRFIYYGVKGTIPYLRTLDKLSLKRIEMFNAAARCVGMLIYDLPRVKTEIASVKWNRLSTNDRIKLGANDHIVPRQMGGEIVYDAFFNEQIKSPEDLWTFAICEKLIFVNKVLRTENTILASWSKKQKIPYRDWKIAYKAVDIATEPLLDLRTVPKADRPKDKTLILIKS